MRKLAIFSLLTLIGCTAWIASVQAQGNNPVPRELVGHWQLGTFSLTNFWNPTTGQYAGNAGEASRSYQIAADGTAEEFFIYNSTSYNCRTQVLGYRKGTIKFDKEAGSFTFCPSSGYYRTANCFKKDWQRKEYSGKDICPQYKVTLYWKLEAGNLVVSDSPGGATSIYKRIDLVRQEP
jgi:hypothetical protein